MSQWVIAKLTRHLSRKRVKGVAKGCYRDMLVSIVFRSQDLPVESTLSIVIFGHATPFRKRSWYHDEHGNGNSQPPG